MSYAGYNSVELRKPKRSTFNLSHERRSTTRMGKLCPILCEETLPNDTWRVNSEILIRLQALFAPIFHQINVYVHFFFVPMRLLWIDWEDFITNGRLGTETPPVPPWIYIDSVKARANNLLDNGSLFDHLGGGRIRDVDDYTARTLDLMPFGAYYKVWYDYYRDRNYYADNDYLPFVSGTQTPTSQMIDDLFTMKQRDWEKDYFTSALLTTQRGAEVLMPLSGVGNVTYLQESEVKLFDGTSDGSLTVALGTAGDPLGANGSVAGGTVTGRIENIDEVNFTNSQITINDFRVAIALQGWLERQMLAGSRMNETIWAHFNRKTSDGRLQRAEYLGGGKVPIQISEVVATAQTMEDSQYLPQGNLAGKAISFGKSNRFTYNCEEWGFIIGIVSVMPRSSYKNGSRRRFFGRNTFQDYAWPAFANLGEQPVYDYELFQSPTNTPVDRTAQPQFGYQSRFVEWKDIPSSSHGDFRGNLSYWTLDRTFADTPTLGAAFVNFEDELQDNIFAVSGVDTVLMYIYNDIKCKRSLPYFAQPKVL